MCAEGSPQRRSAAVRVSHQAWHDTRVSCILNVVIRSFADETTRDLFGNVNSKSARRIANTAWKAAQRKLKQLDLVTRLDDLQIPPGNDLHALKGDQAGRHAIKVNDQYRITFRWEGHDAYDVCCEDYH